MEFPDRAVGYFTTHADAHPSVNEKTTGWRADPEDMNVLDERDDRQHSKLIAERLRKWKAITSA